MFWPDQTWTEVEIKRFTCTKWEERYASRKVGWQKVCQGGRWVCSLPLSSIRLDLAHNSAIGRHAASTSFFLSPILLPLPGHALTCLASSYGFWVFVSCCTVLLRFHLQSCEILLVPLSQDDPVQWPDRFDPQQVVKKNQHIWASKRLALPAVVCFFLCWQCQASATSPLIPFSCSSFL